MKKINKLVFLLFTFLAVFGTVFAQDTVTAEKTMLEGQLTLDDLQALNGDQAEIFVHNDRVTFVNGSCTSDPVKDIADAAAVVSSMTQLLGGDERTHFEPWRTLIDPQNNQYYVFQQMYANTTVLGGAVKVIVDPAGRMVGLTSSIETELPDVEESEGITAEEAEQIVLKNAEDNKQPVLSLIEGATKKMILPVVLSVDDDENEGGGRFVWVVYTDNPDSRNGRGAELPYLAHYVTLDGEYLYSLATIMPEDAAGEVGFDAAYIFEFMEPVDYTGYVDLADGSEMELTVTVMRDKRTGMYYLGNIERQIVVADCWEFLYNGGRVVLASSPDNLEWDQVGLLSLYNYCKAWDYYNEIGWFGGDGKGTPVMILNDFSDKLHNRIDNAAFIGNYLGWSLFGASLANEFSQALDVIAHEFTHCVTDSVMTYNSYMNDYGAINEAISDIQGQICDLMNGNTEDTSWLLGDKTSSPVRSMSNPHLFDQPEFSWDVYYKPAVKTPTAINDYGGVHSNSSLLNKIAYRLVNDGGMSLDEARSFWFAVDCAMVPGTDYPQLSELLPFMLKLMGMDQYQTALQRAIDASRLNIVDTPDFFDNDRALLKISLPDNENFTDGNWGIQIISVDLKGVKAKASEILEKIAYGDYSGFPQVLQDLLAEKDEQAAKPTPEPKKRGIFDELIEGFGLIFDEPVETPEPTPEPEADELSDSEYFELMSWLRGEFEDVIYSDLVAAGQDGHTISMMTRPGRTIPMLLHMAFNEETSEPDQFMTALYVNNRWYVLDMSGFMESSEEETDTETPNLLDEPIVQDMIKILTDNIWKIKSLDDLLDLYTYTIVGGEINEIPSTGLEDVVLPAPSETTEVDAADLVILEPGPKSRPKLDD